LIIAVARPQTVVSLPRIQGNVILAFDVSGSMSADDMKPTRMEAAKAAARNFVERQPAGVQIGIVAFSESGFSVLAPTHEAEEILAAIERLTPERGTSVANGIFTSLNTIVAANTDPVSGLYTNQTPTPEGTPAPVPPGSNTSDVIILLTDGENTTSPDPIEAAQTAADQGVRIYPIGIGSTAGVTIKVNGFTVHTQLDEALLQQIARMTNGAYYNAETEQELWNIYNNLNPQLIIKPEEMEVTALFVGAGIIVLLIGGALSLLWLGRLP
jgi:Ca-activated chloride channel family protein